MHEDVLEAVFINFSRKRSVKIVDDEGNKKTIRWRWDKEGAEGFSRNRLQNYGYRRYRHHYLHICRSRSMIGPIGITLRQAEDHFDFVMI